MAWIIYTVDFALLIISVRMSCCKKATDVKEIENSPLTNVILAFTFVFLSKGLAILAMLFFAVLTYSELEDIVDFYNIPTGSLYDDIDEAKDKIMTSIVFTIINLILLLVSSGTACLFAGTKRQDEDDAMILRNLG